jgi:hypothetical protein
MRILFDKRSRYGYDENGEPLFMCVLHRDKVYTGKKAPERCPYCSSKLFSAHYKYDPSGGNGQDTIYYASWEVMHKSKYNETLTYSKAPPLLSIWMKAWTLLKQDQYIMKYYGMERPPKFFLAFNTTNADSLEKAYNEMIDRAIADPHIPAILAVQSETSGNPAQVVDLMRPLEEMQFIEQREEYRRMLGALFGVSPIFQNDNSNGGGLNNDGLQITVTNRATEYDQTFYNEGFLKYISWCLGCNKNRLVLSPSEELDEMSELQRMQLKLDLASKALEMGMDVQFDKKKGTFTFNGNPTKSAPKASPFGMNKFGDMAALSGTPEEVAQGDKGFQKPLNKRPIK